MTIAELVQPVSLAVRTVSETDDVRVIEGLAYPFKGRDTYGTFFSARTDFSWDLFPDSMTEPQFIRPLTFQHGFDSDFGLTRQGGWSPVRIDDDGVWVQAQIDKRATYYATRLGPLLDAGALGLSGGSAEHSVRIDQRTGEVNAWPAYELALTPVESNPLAQIAARSAETAASLVRITDGSEDVPVTVVPPKAIRYSPSATDASMAAWVLGQLIDLIGEESDEADQVALLRIAADAVQAFITAEVAEIGSADDMDDMDMSATAYLSAIRSHLHPEAPAEPQPVTIVTVREDVPDFEALRAGLLARAEANGKAVAIRTTG